MADAPAPRPTQQAVDTVYNKLEKLGSPLSKEMIRSCLRNAYEADKEVLRAWLK